MKAEHRDNVRSAPPTLRLRLLVLLLVSALAALTTTMTSADSFEDRLIRLQAQDKIPSIAGSLQQESPQINALFLSYANRPSLWMSASLAIEKHGDLARRLLLEYGLVSEFQDVLINFGGVAARSAAALAPAAKVAIVSGMAVAVIRHPSLISGLGANLADWMGWPIWIGQFLLWLIAFAVLFGALRLLFGPMLFVTAPVTRSCLLWVERRRAAKFDSGKVIY